MSLSGLTYGFIFLITVQSALFSEQVDIVLSKELPQYRAASESFKTAFGEHEYKEYVLDQEMDNADKYALLKADKPFAVLAVGTAAAKMLSNYRDSPVIYCMVAGQVGGSGQYGVILEFPFEKQLQGIKKVMPNVLNIGVLFSSGKNASAVKSAGSTAGALGFSLIEVEIKEASELLSKLEEAEPKIDILMLTADPLLDRQNSEFVIRHCVERNIPVVGISDYYVKKGALFAYSFDYGDTGAVAGEVLKKVVSGESVGLIHSARKSILYINEDIRNSLNIFVPNSLLKDAVLIKGE